MTILGHLVVVVCVIISIPSVSASHFKGGAIFWTPTGNGQEILVTARSAWISSTHLCDDGRVRGETTTGDGMSLSCFEGCSGSVSLDTYCSDYCSADNWSQGEGHVIRTFSSSTMKIGYASGAWISMVYGGGSWRLVTTVNTSIRTDTEKINSSPRTSVLQVTQVIIGCLKNINISVIDPDEDVVRCRWADSASNECGGVCGHNNIFSLNQASCVLSVFATSSTVTGFYPIALQVEDFVSSASTSSLSSVPLQFLIRVNATAGCSDPPNIMQPLFSDPFANIPMNGNFTTTVVARTSSSLKSITEIVIVSPLGMTKSSLTTYGSTGREWSITVSWTPTNNQNGSNYLCTAAYDNDGLQSPQLCLRLVYGGISYTKKKSKAFGTGKITENLYLDGNSENSYLDGRPYGTRTLMGDHGKLSLRQETMANSNLDETPQKTLILMTDHGNVVP